MSRDKQIEEMAKDIDKSPWRIEQAWRGCNINSIEIAEHLYTAGYRKASEVAREIFEEIEKLLAVDRNCEANLDVRDLAELKKKYEVNKE